jgi:hypothetical protein
VKCVEEGTVFYLSGRSEESYGKTPSEQTVLGPTFDEGTVPRYRYFDVFH